MHEPQTDAPTLDAVMSPGVVPSVARPPLDEFPSETPPAPVAPQLLGGSIQLATLNGFVLLLWDDPPSMCRLTKANARRLGAELNRAGLT